MILVDWKGHMVSDKSEEELHTFARKLGLKREWYQEGRCPHYDLTTSRMILRAWNMGAEHASEGDIVRRAWWQTEKRKRNRFNVALLGS